MWAANLVDKFGSDLSSKILEAHEMNPAQPKNEEKMDIANNKLGMAVGKGLSDSGKLSRGNLIKAFNENLNSGKFIIIKRRGER